MFENEELRDPGARAAAASSGCSFNPGAYIRTNNRILEKSVLRGRWDRIDYNCQNVRNVQIKGNLQRAHRNHPHHQSHHHCWYPQKPQSRPSSSSRRDRTPPGRSPRCFLAPRPVVLVRILVFLSDAAQCASNHCSSRGNASKDCATRSVKDLLRAGCSLQRARHSCHISLLLLRSWLCCSICDFPRPHICVRGRFSSDAAIRIAPIIWAIIDIASRRSWGA
jgi:hypothetical protein